MVFATKDGYVRKVLRVRVGLRDDSDELSPKAQDDYDALVAAERAGWTSEKVVMKDHETLHIIRRKMGHLKRIENCVIE